jgi:hypothetical protein
MVLAHALLLSLLAAATPPKKRPNMPLGWTWPPTPAMKAAGTECLARLDAANVEYTKGKALKKVSTPVVIPGLVLGEVVLTPLKGKGAYPMDCQLAAAVVEVAPDLERLGVRSLRFRTLHEYRNVRKNGRTTKILSRHAIGLAIDVFAFELTDGSILEVERDWATNAKLAEITAVFAASSRFRTPLSPANDPRDHDDHVHLEAHLRI